MPLLILNCSLNIVDVSGLDGFWGYADISKTCLSYNCDGKKLSLYFISIFSMKLTGSTQGFMQDKIIAIHTCFSGHMDVNC